MGLIIMDIWEQIKATYWRLPFIPEGMKERVYYVVRSLLRGEKRGTRDERVLEKYAQQILDNQLLNNQFSCDFPVTPRVSLEADDVKLIAYYLPQYYPDPHNTRWWGRGSTEWTNTTKSVPQYVGQYQPRLPGELGFYDLRIQDNIRRQIELARIYGIYGFCFYYYWFDGERVLELPLNRFVEDESIDFPFFICWVNESWTKQWSSSSDVTLIEQKHTVKSYKKFIHSCLSLFLKKNYIRVNGRPVLNVYRLYTISEWSTVIAYWRQVVREALGTDIYIVGCLTKEKEYKEDYLTKGFDAVNEFSLSANSAALSDITKKKTFICSSFQGKVYDYPEFVKSKRYFRHKAKKLHRAVVTGFDNTARKRNKGIIFDGATPEFYGKWLSDVIVETKGNLELDEPFVFLFAWNEWAEGAYLEPDLKFQYGYLEETAKALKKSRKMLEVGRRD